MVDLGNGFWWWTGASSAQLAAGVAAYRRGYRGRETLMPLKAFGVAFLFVGAGATAFAGFLHASGIHKARVFFGLSTLYLFRISWVRSQPFIWWVSQWWMT